MDTANTGNLIWAIAVIGGPILLGLVIAFGLMRRRRRRSPVENAAIAERYKDHDGIVEDGVVRPDPTVEPEPTVRPQATVHPDPTRHAGPTRHPDPTVVRPGPTVRRS